MEYCDRGGTFTASPIPNVARYSPPPFVSIIDVFASKSPPVALSAGFPGPNEFAQSLTRPSLPSPTPRAHASTDLQSFLRRQQKVGPLDEERAWNIFLQMASGLHYIHTQRILHRDMKSANVFLCAGGKVKIGDLGVARVLGTNTAFARSLVGTPYYLSPELCEDKPYNEKSDVWALGCILYEMLTLRHPFDASNQGALILKIVQGKYPPVDRSRYSHGVRKLVDALLQRDQRRRPTCLQILSSPVAHTHARKSNVELDVEEIKPPRPVARPSSSSSAGAGAGASTGTSTAATSSAASAAVNSNRPRRRRPKGAAQNGAAESGGLGRSTRVRRSAPGAAGAVGHETPARSRGGGGGGGGQPPLTRRSLRGGKLPGSGRRGVRAPTPEKRVGERGGKGAAAGDATGGGGGTAGGDEGTGGFGVQGVRVNSRQVCDLNVYVGPVAYMTFSH